MPSRTSLYQHVANVRSPELLYNTLLQVLGAIEGLHVTPEPADSNQTLSVLVLTTEITWSRSARRKKMTRQFPQKPFQGSIIMQCRIACAEHPRSIVENQPALAIALMYQWIDGSDRGILESFVSHVNRKVTGRAQP